MLPAVPPTGGCWFPEAIAALALLNRAGFDTRDLYFQRLNDPSTLVECVGIEIRPPGARDLPERVAWGGWVFTWAVEPVDYARFPALADVTAALLHDTNTWNKLDRAAQDQHLATSSMPALPEGLLEAIYAKRAGW